MERGQPETSSYPHIHRAYYYDYNHIKPGRRILTYYYVFSCLDKGVHLNEVAPFLDKPMAQLFEKNRRALLLKKRQILRR